MAYSIGRQERVLKEQTVAKAESDPQEKWHRARLIPTSGISGSDEQERRATSALLAVMTAVREFGHSIVGPIGAPKGPVIETFTEVRFELDGQIVIPDGLIRVTRGKKVWVCLVEVKTGSASLKTEQVHAYLDVARENGFDCVWTISNQLRAVDGSHPLADIDKRKLRKVELHHLSWASILTSAIYQRVHYGVSDTDQAWILAELIRYLEHPRSGAQEFEDMGSSWVEVREAVSNRVLRAKDPATLDVCRHWGQLIRFNCLKMTRRLGVDVVGGELSKRPKSQLDIAKVAEVLATAGRLESSYAIPNTAGPVDLVADLTTGRIEIGITVAAPSEGRQKSRVNWLVRQLKDATDGIRIEAWAKQARSPVSAILKDLREDPGSVVLDEKRDLVQFRVSKTYKMGAQRGTGRNGFVTSVVDALESFYDETIQPLRAWQATAPIRRTEQEQLDAIGIETIVIEDEVLGELAEDISAIDEGTREFLEPVTDGGQEAVSLPARQTAANLEADSQPSEAITTEDQPAEPTHTDNSTAPASQSPWSW
jgi:hypothetical protein